jgi:ketosteroid isomerase-like protein
MTIARDVMTAEQRRSVALECFLLLERGERDELLKLFAGDAQVCVPGRGPARGAAAVGDALETLVGAAYETAYFNFVAADDALVVEGATAAGARFCTVFEIRDFLIERMFAYAQSNEGPARAS